MASAHQSKIYQNIVKQLRIAKEAQELQNKLKQLETDRSQAVGAMEILAEIYEEETGKSLQQAINSDPEWGELIKRAEAEVAGMAAPAVQQQHPTPQPVKQDKHEQPQAEQLPKLRRLNDNKKVAQPQAEQPVMRSRQPVEIVVNDNDDPGPGSIDDDDS